MESKIEKAVSLFKEGYNCSQAVVAAYAEDYGFTREQALKMAASFGGGIGRMRRTCGAACGLFMLAGLETGGQADPRRPHFLSQKQRRKREQLQDRADVSS